MFTPIIRFTLLIICVLTGSMAAIFHNTPILIIASFISLTLLWGYYKLGTVYLALNKMRKGYYDDAQEIINLTKNPERLLKGRRAYYYYVKGYLAREKDDFATAKPLFEAALDQGLKIDQDKAIALLALADMALIDADKEKARSYLYRMKDLKVQPGLMPQIRQMQNYLSE